jgi:glycosyltransferase involved in cell wall biosynthesis
MGDLRCLLISPLPPADPENGDTQYTRDLLANPPDGVTYVAYQDALAQNELVEDVSWRRGGRRPASVAQAASASSRLALNALRQTGALVPDPVRWWQVRGDFDVVHIHCMPTHFSGGSPPLVLTDSAGTFWYWTRVKGYSEARAWKLLRRERRLAMAMGYSHPSARPDPAARALYFVEAGARLARRAGADPANLGVCPVGVPEAGARRADTGDEWVPTLAFVARNFEVKGGPDALEIHRLVRTALPTARLLVAGPSERDPGLEGVEWLGPKTRAELYEEVYPRADVFVYPTRFDAAPLVVMEAMAHGIPVVAPSILALPELVRDGESGLLYPEGDIGSAVEMTLSILQDETLRRRLSAAAAEDFDLRFSADVRNRILGPAYQMAAERPAS